MKFTAITLLASLALSGSHAFAQSGGGGGSSGGGAAGGSSEGSFSSGTSSPATSTGGASSGSGTTLSNGVTVNGTGGAPGANTSNAKSQGTSGNNLGSASALGSSSTLNNAVGNPHTTFKRFGSAGQEQLSEACRSSMLPCLIRPGRAVEIFGGGHGKPGRLDLLPNHLDGATRGGKTAFLKERASKALARELTDDDLAAIAVGAR
jgi:hypothetical protein